MKKPSFILLTFGVFVFFLLAAETLVIKVKTTNLRKEPKFYAQTMAVLEAGENVEELTAQDGWLQVKTSKGLVGWIHSSSAEEKKFSLLALDQSMKTQASSGEVALATKGFNEQVEKEYKTSHPDISFAQVDKMLKIMIPSSEMIVFLKRGKLGEFRGEK